MASCACWSAGLAFVPAARASATKDSARALAEVVVSAGSLASAGGASGLLSMTVAIKEGTMRPERVPTDLLRHPVAAYCDYDPYWADEEQAVMRKIERFPRWRKEGVSCGHAL
jgi:hypothetical protein